MGGARAGEQLLTHGVRPVINPCTSTLTPPPRPRRRELFSSLRLWTLGALTPPSPPSPLQRPPALTASLQESRVPWGAGGVSNGDGCGCDSEIIRGQGRGGLMTLHV